MGFHADQNTRIGILIPLRPHPFSRRRTGVKCVPPGRRVAEMLMTWNSEGHLGPANESSISPLRSRSTSGLSALAENSPSRASCTTALPGLAPKRSGHVSSVPSSPVGRIRHSAGDFPRPGYGGKGPLPQAFLSTARKAVSIFEGLDSDWMFIGAVLWQPGDECAQRAMPILPCRCARRHGLAKGQQRRLCIQVFRSRPDGARGRRRGSRPGSGRASARRTA